MQIEFEKMSGTGNDFIVVDNRNGIIPEEKIKLFAITFCPRKISVGADGVLLLENSDKADFRMRIINSDGSEAEMCGNGSRCIADFALRHGIAGETMKFETLAGIIEAEIKDNLPKVKLIDTKAPRFIEKLIFAGTSSEVYSLNTGVPHVVVKFNDLEDIDIHKWGREIRMHTEFGPNGTNVNFISKAGNNAINVRTYERGVEAETLACGTGATASAITASIIWNMVSPVEVYTRSRELLNIYFSLSGRKYTDIYLEGAVKLVYKAFLDF